MGSLYNVGQSINSSVSARLKTAFGGMIDPTRTQKQNRARVNELVEAVKATRNITSSGTTSRASGTPEMQKKSLDAFQTRLDNLRKERMEKMQSAESEI